MIHCRYVVIQNENARGCDDFLVNKSDKMVAQNRFVVLKCNKVVDKSAEVVIQTTFEVQQTNIVVCFCSNVSLHSGNVVIQNGKVLGHSHRIYKF